MTDRDHRRGLFIDVTSGTRFDLAMERFLSGDTIAFRDIALRIEADGSVHCIVESSWRAENVTLASASDDLAAGDAHLHYLMEASPVFRDAVCGRPVAVDLVEDYGMGSVLICTKRDGRLDWAPGFPRAAG